LDVLTKIVSIDDVKDNVVYAYANDTELAKLAAAGYSYTMLPNPIEGANPQMAKSSRDAKAWDVYPTYQQYLDMMNQFETDHPAICEVINFGRRYKAGSCWL